MSLVAHLLCPARRHLCHTYPVLYLERFAPSWREFHQLQMSKTRVLVVDDDENVGRFLRRTFKRQGFSVDSVLSVAEGWALIQNAPYDLVLIDKTMPHENGLVLLKRLQESEFNIPAVLITGDPSAETVDEALRLGAEDYIRKPFVSTQHLVSRIGSVLDRRITGLLFDVMLGDLSKAVLSGTGRSDQFTRLSQSLLELKTNIGKRAPCVVIDDDEMRRETRRAAIYEAGVIAIGADPANLDTLFLAEGGPLVAAVSLESEGALEIIGQLHSANPNVPIMAFASVSDVDTALQAVEAGASDFTMLYEEGMVACTQRIERLVRQTRRHHLYLDIVGLLYSAACEVHPDLPEELIFATSPADRQYIMAR